MGEIQRSFGGRRGSLGEAQYSGLVQAIGELNPQVAVSSDNEGLDVQGKAAFTPITWEEVRLLRSHAVCVHSHVAHDLKRSSCSRKYHHGTGQSMDTVRSTTCELHVVRESLGIMFFL